MFIDVVVLILLALAFFKGLQKGFIVGVFSFLAFVIGLAAALKLSASVAVYLGKNVSVAQQWLPVIAFALVFFLVAFLVRLGAKAIEGVVRLALLGWLNKLGGILLFALLYLFIFSVLLFYAAALNIIKPAAAEASVTYPFLHLLGSKIIAGIGTVLPFFKDVFNQLTGFFDAAAN